MGNESTKPAANQGSASTAAPANNSPISSSNPITIRRLFASSSRIYYGEYDGIQITSEMKKRELEKEKRAKEKEAERLDQPTQAEYESIVNAFLSSTDPIEIPSVRDEDHKVCQGINSIPDLTPEQKLCFAVRLGNAKLVQELIEGDCGGVDLNSSGSDDYWEVGGWDGKGKTLLYYLCKSSGSSDYFLDTILSNNLHCKGEGFFFATNTAHAMCIAKLLIRKGAQITSESIKATCDPAFDQPKKTLAKFLKPFTPVELMEEWKQMEEAEEETDKAPPIKLMYKFKAKELLSPLAEVDDFTQTSVISRTENGQTEGDLSGLQPGDECIIFMNTDGLLHSYAIRSNPSNDPFENAQLTFRHVDQSKNSFWPPVCTMMQFKINFDPVKSFVYTFAGNLWFIDTASGSFKPSSSSPSNNNNNNSNSEKLMISFNVLDSWQEFYLSNLPLPAEDLRLFQGVKPKLIMGGNEKDNSASKRINLDYGTKSNPFVVTGTRTNQIVHVNEDELPKETIPSFGAAPEATQTEQKEEPKQIISTPSKPPVRSVSPPTPTPSAPKSNTNQPLSPLSTRLSKVSQWYADPSSKSASSPIAKLSSPRSSGSGVILPPIQSQSSAASLPSQAQVASSSSTPPSTNPKSSSLRVPTFEVNWMISKPQLLTLDQFKFFIRNPELNNIIYLARVHLKAKGPEGKVLGEGERPILRPNLLKNMSEGAGVQLSVSLGCDPPTMGLWDQIHVVPTEPAETVQSPHHEHTLTWKDSYGWNCSVCKHDGQEGGYSCEECKGWICHQHCYNAPTYQAGEPVFPRYDEATPSWTLIQASNDSDGASLKYIANPDADSQNDTIVHGKDDSDEDEQSEDGAKIEELPDDAPAEPAEEDKAEPAAESAAPAADATPKPPRPLFSRALILQFGDQSQFQSPIPLFTLDEDGEFETDGGLKPAILHNKRFQLLQKILLSKNQTLAIPSIDLASRHGVNDEDSEIQSGEETIQLSEGSYVELKGVCFFRSNAADPESIHTSARFVPKFIPFSSTGGKLEGNRVIDVPIPGQGGDESDEPIEKVDSLKQHMRMITKFLWPSGEVDDEDTESSSSSLHASLPGFNRQLSVQSDSTLTPSAQSIKLESISEIARSILSLKQKCMRSDISRAEFLIIVQKMIESQYQIQGVTISESGNTNQSASSSSSASGPGHELGEGLNQMMNGMGQMMGGLMGGLANGLQQGMTGGANNKVEQATGQQQDGCKMQ